MFSSFSQFLTRESGEIEVLSLEQVNLPKSSVTDLWDSNGSIICSESNTQENPKICSNEDDGAIIVWRDRRNESLGGDIYAQRFHKTGTRQWTANGTAVCTAINRQYKPEICSDGLGGAFIAWVDERAGDQKIYIQRVTELESKPFTANGTIIEPLGGDQSEVKICSDGANGAFIVWVDDKNGNDDIFAQRIDQDGNLLWLNEAEVCTESSLQSEIQIINDGQGGLIITWEDSRGYYDIYAQKLDSNGNLLWAPNGVLVCNEEDQQREPQLCNDGLGGVIITWYDYRDGSGNSDIYAQRINSEGTVLWNINGSIVNVENNEQWKSKICSDGNGGAIVTWYDYRLGIDYDIYAQKINSNGNRVWDSSGIPICIEDGYQYYPDICSDGFGGAVIAWIDFRGMDTDIYSQRIDASSNTYWTAGGTPVTVAGSNQEDFRLIPDNFGGAIFTWEDARGADKDIYSQRLKENPIVTINSPVSQTLFSNTTPSFNVEYLVSDLDDMWYTVNGGANNPITTNGSISQSIWDSLGNGTVTIRFYADDIYGTEGYSEVVVHKDILGPDIAINYPEDGRVFKDIIPSYSITVEDGNLDTVWYTLNGGPEIIVARATPIVSVSKPIDEEAWNALKEGPVTIQFHANDTLGNPATPKGRVIHKSVTNFWEEPWFSGLVIALVIVILTSTMMYILRRRKTVVIKPPKKIKPFKIETKGKIFDLQIRRNPDAEKFVTFILNESEIAERNKKLEIKKLKTIVKVTGEVKTSIFKDISSKMEKLIQFIDENKTSKGLLEKLQIIGKLIRVIFPANIIEELNKLNGKSPFLLRLESDLLNIPWEILPVKEEIIKEDKTRKSKKRDRSKNIKGIEVNLALKFGISRKIPNEEFQLVSKKKKSVKILIIADPARKLRLEDDGLLLQELHDLQEAREEGEELDKNLSAINGVNTKLLPGSSATRDAVITELGEGYDIIHYCGHAFFDKENPGHSYLELNDKDLYAFELKNLLGENPPILVFINACLSSKEEIWTKPTYENQVFGLASSFLSNGINYIGSLLPIHDKEARKTAEKFYFELLNGKPIGEALRNAKQEVFDSIKDQSLGWGSYTLYGNPLLRISYKKKKRNSKEEKINE